MLYAKGKMWPILIVWIAQYLTDGDRAMLLPKPLNIANVVMDAEGKPIEGASLHLTDRWQDPKTKLWIDRQTDASGRFEVETDVPVIVVRQAGFESFVLKTPNANQERIVLVPTNRSIPACPKKPRCRAIRTGTFCFPKTPGISAEDEVGGLDAVDRVYGVKTAKGRKYFQHGAGFSWSYDSPRSGDVWTASDYHEVVFANRIVDASWHDPEGFYQRYFGYGLETIEYKQLDAAAASKADEMIDGVCLLSHRHN